MQSYLKDIGINPGGLIIIVISKFIKRYSKAKRTRAQAYSQALNKLVLVPLRVVTPSDFGMGGRGGSLGLHEILLRVYPIMH